ncbi:MAG: Eco57I restriction-modification methylase domain-containing protein [Erysipelotrichaceae bacterium]
MERKKTKIIPNSINNKKIYGYTLPESKVHNNLVKIGETTRDVKTRITEQVGTAGLNPSVLFDKKAKRNDGKWFTDKDIHNYIEYRGYFKKILNDISKEWFEFPEGVHKAEELVNDYIASDYDYKEVKGKLEYILRSEQQKAVDMTIAYYNKVKGSDDYTIKRFLWNAKPRFGKTLTAYDFMLSINSKRTLIVTNRPAISNSWYDDFYKFIAHKDEKLKFYSDSDSLAGKAITRSEFLDKYVYEDDIKEVAFISLQDLKGAQWAGGPYQKLEWVKQTPWDLLIIDEAHEGVDTDRTEKVFEKIKRKFELHLSGTPFKAIANNKFSEEQIYNWSYLEEQQAKENWNILDGTNPYEVMPSMNMFTYQMSEIIEDKVKKGLTFDDDSNVDFTFDLGEFFSTKPNGTFIYEDSVKKFLDNLSQGKFPFAKQEYAQDLNHTFWLLSRVNSAKALEKMLRNHLFFKDYTIILAAGDGKSFEEEANDLEKVKNSYDRVKKAIEENEKTITLSVGQLTTGVTIPEWSAVFMLSNISSPSNYFQAAFRAQNPYQYIDDNNNYIFKENSYVFDFAPDRTLVLYDSFANNLKVSKDKSDENRKENIKELINFFPVIAEDEKGSLKPLTVDEVLIFPNRIKATEVVKRGFMSNLLFKNIFGIFKAPKEIVDIFGKMKPEKGGKTRKQAEFERPNITVDDDGNTKVETEIVINKTKDIFGEKIYKVYQIPQKVNDVKETVKIISKQMSDEDIFEKLKEIYSLTIKKQNEIKKSFEKKVNEEITELITKYVSGNIAYDSISTKLNKIEEESQQYLIKELEVEIQEAVKKTTEDDVRDRLRGFTRTIPSFLMAYGDNDTTLANFEEKIDDATFVELTNITKIDFRKLRDGFDYVDDDGNNRKFDGCFDEGVFNAAIREFLKKKEELKNYFDESVVDDIFSYIPPQKNNQIFTPKEVVKLMVDKLEEENPNIFKNYKTKFIDLYCKSGLYLTEIVKRLNKNLKAQIPNDKERITYIFENQIYGLCPTNITYNIVKNFVYPERLTFDKTNIVQEDILKLIKNKCVNKKINEIYGGNDLKFDVVIGNPPYQDETIGENETYAPPIYHKFMDEAYNLANKVILITPARFLFNAGSTPKSWNKKMLNDEHLRVVYYNENAAEVFPNTDIKGGITVTLRDTENIFGKIKTFIPDNNMKNILNKVIKGNFKSFGNLVYARTIYRFSDKLHKDYPEAESMLSVGHKYDISSNIFERLPQVFENKKIDESYIKIYGREDNKRTFKWFKSEYLVKPENFNYYKLIVPTANGTGKFGEVLSDPFVLNPKESNTETFINIGKFKSFEDAVRALKYIKTKFLRALLSTLKVTQTNTQAVWRNIPLQDFTENSNINWSKSISEIDQQLYEKYGLNEEEIKFIEENVQAMD